MTIPNPSSTNQKQTTLTIFPPLPQASWGGCSCSCQPTARQMQPAVDPWEAFSAQLRQALERDATPPQIEVAAYTSAPAVRSTLRRLNEVFTASGVSYQATVDELSDLLLAYAPIIAVNDRIVATQAFPEVEQLIELIKTGTVPKTVESPADW